MNSNVKFKYEKLFVRKLKNQIYFLLVLIQILDWFWKIFYLFQVLEVLLATCNNVIHNFKEEREGHLQGLERIAKSTILGHLLPVLLTAMNHVNLHCLPLADELMPKLVNLVVLSSQVLSNIILRIWVFPFVVHVHGNGL